MRMELSPLVSTKRNQSTWIKIPFWKFSFHMVIYMLIPLSFRYFPLLAKVILIIIFFKYMQYLFQNVLLFFLYNKNKQGFDELIKLLLLQLHNEKDEAEKNKDNDEKVRLIVDDIYTRIQEIMKSVIWIYFVFSKNSCNHLYQPPGFSTDGSKIVSTPRRIANLWDLQGVYMNLYVVLLRLKLCKVRDKSVDESLDESHHKSTDQQDEKTLFKNIRNVYKLKYTKEYEMMKRNDEFSFFSHFGELVCYSVKQTFICFHFFFFTTISIYYLSRSFFILSYYKNVLKTKLRYENSCKNRDMCDELFFLLIDSISHLSYEQTDAPSGANSRCVNDDESQRDRKLSTYETMECNLLKCIKLINVLKSEHSKDNYDKVLHKNPKNTNESENQEELASNYVLPSEKEVYETEPLKDYHKDEEAHSGATTSQKKQPEEDAELMYEVYVYESGNEDNQMMMQNEGKMYTERRFLGPHSQYEHNQKTLMYTYKKYFNCKGENSIDNDGLVKNHTSSYINDTIWHNKQFNEVYSDQPIIDSKMCTHINCANLINELKAVFKKEKRYVYLNKKLFYDQSLCDFVIREYSSVENFSLQNVSMHLDVGENGDGENGDGENGDGENGDGENGDGENGDGENGDGENGDGENGDGENGDDENGDDENGDDENRDDENGDDENRDDENRDGQNGDDVNTNVNANEHSKINTLCETGQGRSCTEHKTHDQGTYEEDYLRPIIDIPSFRQSIAATILQRSFI
ncbi:hypothetical protein, conserved [Plasmodium gonderi]|uniref:Uncharacterized protein n=1 Tax=Plasmodium gonderi TaxID=77519 RepID=A0A1Y1JTC2_PLAGO|nr:hypothetical protein, conserved [Plasmodium gonderi]GAW83673.1 hypothetical protein, conserved [Plasmodium gonderi]